MNPRKHHRLLFADGDALELGERTVVMGILNVTPDSFSDGGRFNGTAGAIDAAHRMVEDGAQIVDIGGESTRPGADPVSELQECERVLPLIEGLRDLEARISIDTRKATVARQAIAGGADLVNDVSALRDPEMLPLIVESETPVVLMHMRGEPETMQTDTRYDDLPASVLGFLEDRVQSAIAAGHPDGKILVDPGVGFGKSAAGNAALLKQLPALGALEQPILIGASRKSFMGSMLGVPLEERLEPSLAVAAYASARGAHVIRAHDVAPTVKVVRMIDAIRGTEADES